MAETLWLLVVLLPLAFIGGWWLASSRNHRGQSNVSDALSRNYFRGLNYLLNEQPDKASEVFLQLSEINQETAETHLALGRLFRRRGEVDKAIRFHRHIMKHDELSEQHRTEAVVELGEDYMRAGLLDRAEKLFTELAKQGRYSETAIRSLLSIYQQEKDWPRAIVQARALKKVCGLDTDPMIAQLYCELAAAALKRGDVDEVHNHLFSARNYQVDCVRADLIEGRLAYRQQNCKAAITAWRRACEHDADLAVLILDELYECEQRLGQQLAFAAWLKNIAEQTVVAGPMLAIARVMAEQRPADAIEYLLEQLQQTPSVRGLHYLLQLMHEHEQGLVEMDPSLIRQVTRKLLDGQPRFRCRQCGFSGQSWHWQCPSCRQWETTRPVSGVLGE